MIPKDLWSFLSDPKEKKVIELRFGLNGNEPHTLSEIGKKLNHSREKIRNIEMLAIKHLKDAIKKRERFFPRRPCLQIEMQKDKYQMIKKGMGINE